METQEAYLILKEAIELDEETQDAYEEVLANPVEYETVIESEVEIAISSLEMGQSLMAAGEIVKCLYNGTHRLIESGEIIDLPGAEIIKKVGPIMGEQIQKIAQINQMTEEYAAAMVSINDTVDMSYM